MTDPITTPHLLHAFDVVAEVAAPVEVGDTPLGARRLIPILAGSVSGPKLSGKLIPGGVDYQIIRADGLADIHARYVIETGSGARVYVENTGIRHGPPEAMARLRRGEPVDPALIYFRATPKFETADPELAWLMRSIFVCSGARFPDKVVLRMFEVT
ncbi:MAG: hypothetical protein CFE31_16000 [Rhizobiales bacterium PAR1]|nr:MAG: hypothetical protein CFE31_16000 [Rhizobiales bacterium PAR1]